MSLFVVVEGNIHDARQVFNAAVKDKYPGELESLGIEGYEEEITDEKIREVMEGLGFRVFTGDELHESHLDEG